MRIKIKNFAGSTSPRKDFKWEFTGRGPSEVYTLVKDNPEAKLYGDYIKGVDGLLKGKDIPSDMVIKVSYYDVRVFRKSGLRNDGDLYEAGYIANEDEYIKGMKGYFHFYIAPDISERVPADYDLWLEKVNELLTTCGVK